MIDQYLTFLIAGDPYAVGVAHVREIVGFDSPTRVPGTPPWIRGVVNLRGLVVPVVDLAVKFGRAASEVTRRTCVVIVELQLGGEPVTMGIMVDAVSQVIELTPEQILPPPTFGANVRIDYLLGLVTTANTFASLLDIERVLTAEEMLAAEDSAALSSPRGSANAVQVQGG
ncbi:MAG TPA: chemotaxis protein CheW [Thermoanaerobaculia bacterium]